MNKHGSTMMSKEMVKLVAGTLVGTSRESS